MYKFLTCAASNGRLVVVSKYDANNLTNRLWARQIGNIGYHSTYYQTPIGLAVDSTYAYLSYNFNGQSYGSIEVVDISNGNSVAVHNLASDTRVQSISADNNGYLYVLYSNTVVNGGSTWAGDTYTIDKIKVSDWSTVWSKTISATSVAYTRTGNTTIYGDKLWSVIYTDSTQVTEIQNSEIRDVLNVSADIIPNSSKYNIGSNLDKWNYIYAEQFRLAANTVIFSPDNNALWFNWYDTSNSTTRYVCFEDTYFYPTTGNTISLGKFGNSWANIWTYKLTFGTNQYITGNGVNQLDIFWRDIDNGVNNLLRFTSRSVAPISLGNYDISLGSSNNYWANVYTKKLTLNGTEYSSIPAAANNGSYAIQINGATKGTVYANGTGTNTINLGTYLTSHQSLSGYATLAGNNTWTGNNTFNNTITCGGALSTTGQISCGGALTVGGDIKRSSGDLVVSATNGEARLTGTSAVRLRSASASAGNAGTNLRRYANVTAGKSGDENPIVTYVSSDIRMKKDISDASFEGLDIINKVHLVKFRYKIETEEHYQHIGVIAQEVEKDIPEAKDVVLHGEDDEKDMLFVEYGMFTPYLIKAVQELSSKVDELNAKIKELESKK